MIRESQEAHSFWKVFAGASGLEKASLVISSWFFCGLLPGAPGTFATVAAVIPAFVLGYLPLLWRGLLIGGLTGLAIMTSAISASALGQGDPSVVVIDEVAGYLVGVCLLPHSIIILMLAFIFFRVFDILKPFPIRQIEKKVRGGLGIVLDDLLAGFCAFIIVKGIVVVLSGS